ncbi:MAG: transglutaminase family protein [Bacteroidia bacterium]|nr:transglutaminase family protein [Bacteroidia bacterium]
MDTTNLHALISLLDDPDATIYLQIKEELIRFGPGAIQPLEQAWEHSQNEIFQKRIEELIHQIQFSDVQNQLREWALSEKQDLFTGAILVAKLHYTDINEKKLNQKIEQIKKDIWLEINDNLTALEKVKVINHLLFDVHEFSGEVTDYHSAKNSFFNIVLDTKKGNPLSLSILYIILAERLNLPIYGVNLPEHFILCYADVFTAEPTNEEIKNAPILFYVNAFSKGIVFSRKDIDNFLKQLNIDSRAHYYKPCSNLEMIKRMLRNLLVAFEKSNQTQKKEEMQVILEMLENTGK